MTPEEWKTIKRDREKLIAQIRKNRSTLNPEYVSTENNIVPCCSTCEFFFSSGRCAAGMKDIPGYEYGHEVTDPDDVCLSWGASYDAFCEGLRTQKAKNA